MNFVRVRSHELPALTTSRSCCNGKELTNMEQNFPMFPLLIIRKSNYLPCLGSHLAFCSKKKKQLQQCSASIDDSKQTFFFLSSPIFQLEDKSSFIFLHPTWFIPFSPLYDSKLIEQNATAGSILLLMCLLASLFYLPANYTGSPSFLFLIE